MFQINEQDIKQEIEESDLLEDICIPDDVSIKQEHQEILDIKEENLSDIDDATEEIALNYQNKRIKEEHLEHNRPLSEIKFVNVSDFNKPKSKHNNFNDLNLKNDSQEKVHVFKCVQCKCDTFRTSVYSNRCDRCIVIYKHKLELSDEHPFECNQYDSSATKSYLKQHQRKHTGERPFKCNQCEYSATTKDYINKHKLIHINEVEEYSYTCDQCIYSTSKKRYLKSHNKLKHTKRITYNCDRCAYRARTKKHFQVHRSKFNCRGRISGNVRNM